jgi:hypothetical protein
MYDRENKITDKESTAMATRRPAARAASTFNIEHDDLGPLTEFPGTWAGTGFNLISRPDFQNKGPFHLEINGTLENLAFTLIGGAIPNRGSFQRDAFLHGVTYLQQVADCETHGALHIEPGLWIHIPPTTIPSVTQSTVVRQGTIPHGDSLLAQSTFIDTVAKGPTIDPVFSLPFTDATIPGLNAKATAPITNAEYLAQFTNQTLNSCCLPSGVSLNAAVADPTTVLRAAIQGQNITETVVIVISTVAASGSTGILNIPFVVKNANALQMDAIFWIETVQPGDNGPPFMQLQYVQRVILDFPPAPTAPIIHWPHISVATLVKQ